MFKIIEMAGRLPGPLACALMRRQGDQVIRLEIADRPDPFKEQVPEQTLFNFWYKSFSATKDIQTCNDGEKLDRLVELSQSCHGLILSHHLSNQAIIKKLKETNAGRPFVVVELCSSQDHRPLHDLNVLADSGLLAWHLKLNQDSTPLFAPFIPIGGIFFATQIAAKFYRLLAHAVSRREFLYERIYLDESVSHLSSLVFPSDDPFISLHAGAYPCYGLYCLNAGNFLAVGAIEAHFWKTFLQEFGLERFLAHQYDQSPSIKEAIALQLQKMSMEVVRQKVQDNSACLSLVSLKS